MSWFKMAIRSNRRRSTALEVRSFEDRIVPATTGQVVFDFEDFGPGSYAELKMKKDGVTATVTRPEGMEIVENMGYATKPAEWGTSTLSSFNAESTPTPYIINFSSFIRNFSILAGDYSQDTDSLQVEAFSGKNATGKLLGGAFKSLPGGGWDFSFQELRVEADKIRSVRLICGSENYPHSMYYDQMVVTPQDVKPTLKVYEGSPEQSQAQRFSIQTISGEVQMPRLKVEIENLPPDADPDNLLVAWTFKVRYKTGNGSPTGAKTLKGIEFTRTGLGSTYPVEWDTIRGGDLDITARFEVNGKTYVISSEKTSETKNLKILGENPTRAEVQQFIDSQPVPANWPSGTHYDYHSILRKIAAHETKNLVVGGYGQFYTSGLSTGHPTWNTGGDTGVGIMQITNPTIDEDDVWNWQENLLDGAAKLNQGLSIATTWPTTITSVQGKFQKAVDKLNHYRKVHGDDPLTQVVVPAWTPDQRVEAAIRMYNGVGGPADSIGIKNRLHEFQLATIQIGATRYLDLQVDESTLVGMAAWQRVPVSIRTQGEPNYVQLVLNASDA